MTKRIAKKIVGFFDSHGSSDEKQDGRYYSDADEKAARQRMKRYAAHHPDEVLERKVDKMFPGSSRWPRQAIDAMAMEIMEIEDEKILKKLKEGHHG